MSDCSDTTKEESETRGPGGFVPRSPFTRALYLQQDEEKVVRLTAEEWRSAGDGNLLIDYTGVVDEIEVRVPMAKSPNVGIEEVVETVPLWPRWYPQRRKRWWHRRYPKNLVFYIRDQQRGIITSAPTEKAAEQIADVYTLGYLASQEDAYVAGYAAHWRGEHTQ